MKIELSQKSIQGHKFSLTLESLDVPDELVPDLATGDAETRIYRVLRRELNRCVEIAQVAFKDAKVQREQEAEHLKMRVAGTLPPKGPAQIVGVGRPRDEQQSRLIQLGDRFVPAPEYDAEKKKLDAANKKVKE
jgi:hypothetical protein